MRKINSLPAFSQGLEGDRTQIFQLLYGRFHIGCTGHYYNIWLHRANTDNYIYSIIVYKQTLFNWPTNYSKSLILILVCMWNIRIHKRFSTGHQKRHTFYWVVLNYKTLLVGSEYQLQIWIHKTWVSSTDYGNIFIN